MTTAIILVVTHVAAFILGALVFRNNSTAVETKIDEVSTKVDEIKKVV